MPKLPPALALGLQHHRSGNLAEAERIYRRILQDDPDHADVLCVLGAVRLVTDRSEEAVADLRRALAIRPDYPEAHNNLGMASPGSGASTRPRRASGPP